MGQTYPNILAIARASMGDNFQRPGCDEDFEFVIALDLILDAIERPHHDGWVSGTAR